MSKVCSVCGKGNHVGGRILHKGLSKKKGGIGLQLLKNTKRVFSPNLQRVRVRQPGGNTRRALVCAACIRSNKVAK